MLQPSATAPMATQGTLDGLPSSGRWRMMHSTISSSSGSQTAAAIIIGKTALMMKKAESWYATPATSAPKRPTPSPRRNRSINTPASHNCTTVNQP